MEIYVDNCENLNMIAVTINGELREFADGSTLASVVNELGFGEKRIAIELNGEVAKRSDWPQSEVQNHDKIEVVHFVGGG